MAIHSGPAETTVDVLTCQTPPVALEGSFFHQRDIMVPSKAIINASETGFAISLASMNYEPAFSTRTYSSQLVSNAFFSNTGQ
jgi:hypothetical protein